MCCGTEAGSYLRLIDSCITQLKAQGPSRTCDESKEEEEEQVREGVREAGSKIRQEIDKREILKPSSSEITR